MYVFTNRSRMPRLYCYFYSAYVTLLILSQFTNGLGNRVLIPSRVIQKTQKWYLMPPCLTLNIIR